MDQLNNLQNKDGELKVFLADIVSKDFWLERLQDRMIELENLVKTYWWLVVLQTYQKKDTPDANTYVGKGKMEEITQGMKDSGANLLIIGNVLKPSQIYKINELLRPFGAKARDRVDLILKIFDKHATWMEARLQIELAAIKHMGPRIFDMSMELGKQGTGTGSKWPGETNTEIMKRHLRERQYKIAKKLEEYEKMRKLHREGRLRKWLITIGIVWYTNAGKSSLLNIMTNKWTLVENKLFATLGTHVGKIFLMTNKETGQGVGLLLNDTIGFIRDLPPNLIKAFSSTLEDSINSQYLLHVVDASDPFVDEKIDVVNEILDQIGATQPRIMVRNKIDLISVDKLAELKAKHPWKDNLRISIKSATGINIVKEYLTELVK